MKHYFSWAKPEELKVWRNNIFKQRSVKKIKMSLYEMNICSKS